MADDATRPERGAPVDGERAWPSVAIDGRFRFRREIARGGMGRVVEAEDTQLGRIVAVKEALDDSDDTRMRFAREVEVTARLEHPSIVPVYDAGVSAAGDPYYVMRRVTGAPLDRLVADAAALDDRLVLLPNMLAVADAVAHAHGRGVIHRDLKPGNVLVGELGETVVIDWGLAKIVGADEVSSAVPPPSPRDRRDRRPLETTAGAVIGTPGYMAPEQVTADATDARTDVYALGACLYHVLAGRPPLAGMSEAEILARTADGTVPPLASVVAGVPSDLVTIVETAMARDPARRYLDAGGFGEDLRRFLAGRLVASHRYGPGQRLIRWLRRHRALVTVIAIAAALLVAGGVLAIGRIVDAQRRTAAALDRERERADDIVVTQAASLAATDPTRAVATLATLPPASSRWATVGPLVAEARAHGVAVGYPGTGPSLTRFEWAPDPGDHRVLTSGLGAVRLVDLDRRTSTTLVVDDMVFAEWAGPLVLVLRRDRRRASPYLLDPATRAEADVPWPRRIVYSRGAPGVIALADEDGAAVTVDVRGGIGAIAGRAPVVLATRPGAVFVWFSPTGAYLVVTGNDWTQLLRRDAADADGPRYTVFAELPIAGQLLVFSPDETRVAILDHLATPAALVELELPGGATRRRWTDGLAVALGYTVDNELYGYAFHAAEIRHYRDGDRTAAIARADHYAGTTVVPVRDAVVVLAADRELQLRVGGLAHTIHSPLDVTSIEASRDGRFVLGSSPSTLLAWDLAPIQWERAPAPDVMTLGFVGPDELRAYGGEGAGGPHHVQRYQVAPGGPFAITAETIGRLDFVGPIEWGDGIVAERGPDYSLRLHRPAVRRAALPDLEQVVGLDAGAIAGGTRGGRVVRIDRATGAITPIAELAGAIVALASTDGWMVAQTSRGELWRRAPDGTVTRGAARGCWPGIAISSTGDVYLGCELTLARWTGGAHAPARVAALPFGITWLRRIAGDRIAVATPDAALAVYDPTARTLRPAVSPADAIVLADDGRRAVAWLGGALVAIDLATGERWTLVDRFPLAGGGLAISPDGATVIAGALDPDRREGDGEDAAAGPGTLYRWSLPPPADPRAWITGATNAIQPPARGSIDWRSLAVPEQAAP